MALKQASLEAFGGIYDSETLDQMVKKQEITDRAWQKIMDLSD
jgi:hypothetical protein